MKRARANVSTPVRPSVIAYAGQSRASHASEAVGPSWKAPALPKQAPTKASASPTQDRDAAQGQAVFPTTSQARDRNAAPGQAAAPSSQDRDATSSQASADLNVRLVIFLTSSF